jgi:AcrR family transcriptional regulator
MIAMITPSMTVAVTSATGGSRRWAAFRDESGAAGRGRVSRARDAMTVAPPFSFCRGYNLVTSKSFYQSIGESGRAVAHEVVKRVGRRAYRYLVESYRDPDTKKVRSRWKYLGIVPAEARGQAPTKERGPESAPAAKPTRDTRERLVSAFLELVNSEPYEALTAGMVASKAGLAHGTFYRYFRDKRAVFMAALERVKAEFDRGRPTFDPPIGDLDAERARVRAWVAMLSRRGNHRGMIRAFYDALEDDPELGAMRRARRAERSADLARYLERLVAGNIADVPDPAALAAALTAMVDGVLREAAGDALENATVSGVADVFDRAIFKAAEGSSSATDSRAVSVSK